MSTKHAKSAKHNAIHITLQGKGGVGKSFVSALLAQYLTGVDGNVVKCVDTDPVNATFTNYKALKGEHITLMNGSKIDERNFDNLMERLITEDGVFVVDNGASSFVPLSNYLIENKAFSMLQEAGREVFIHTVLVGSQSMKDTLSGFHQLALQDDIKNIVVWLNEFQGEIEVNGKSFTELKIYNDHAAKVRGIVRIARRNPDTFGKDIQVMAQHHMTFNEVLASGEFSLMAKQRMKTVQRETFEQIAAIGL